MPKSKKRKVKIKKREFKDIHDFIQNATDDEFAKGYARLVQQNKLPEAGWLVQERIRLKGYHRIG
jgi:hypothetical protein